MADRQSDRFFLETPISKFFETAKSNITIVGINALIPYLEKAAEWFSNFLTANPELTLTILYESDTENFNQSICMDTSFAPRRTTFSTLTVHRDRIAGTESNAGLIREMAELIEDEELRKSAEERIELRQLNLRTPVNLLLADDQLWYCISTHQLPTIDSYIEVPQDAALYGELRSWAEFLVAPHGGGPYLSTPNEELIWVYDKQGIPRGIFPRAAFYTTEFRRYSVWGLVFNRRGQLLLQRRSMHTKDNRGLWDKSIGGHVDLEDSSTSITVKRELVEEMFLPEAEYTKYLRADLGDIIDFGEWNIRKRPERYFRQAFNALGDSDWVMFRATTNSGAPLTVTRISDRRIHQGDSVPPIIRRTVFMSDVYLFIAPSGYLDDFDQMKSLVEMAEKKGAASDHKLVTIGEFREWISKEENSGTAPETVTDDLVAINLEHRPLLEEFAEFIRYVFPQGSTM
jgi:hypothetical protein